MGSLFVRAPIDLQILEGGRVIGSSNDEVRLSSGTHTLDFSIDQPFVPWPVRRSWTFTVATDRPDITITRICGNRSIAKLATSPPVPLPASRKSVTSRLSSAPTRAMMSSAASALSH